MTALPDISTIPLTGSKNAIKNMDIYKQTIDQVNDLFQTSTENGLKDEEASVRLKKDGENIIVKTNQRSLWMVFFEQFKNPLVFLLIIAAGMSFYLGSYRDGIVLAIIVLVNAFIGFYQDWKSENILASIGGLLEEKCIVLRNGKKKEIPVNQIVKGDLISVLEGNGVPADIRLVNSVSLLTNDFILTGESQPKEKDAKAAYTEDIGIADRNNCIFMGTTIAKGEALGIVYSTGMETELGKIAGTSMSIKQEQSPLQKEMGKLAIKISVFTFILGAALFAFKVWQHDSISASLIFAVSIAAAMVPEGLPAQISIALSLGVQRLAKRKAIVKKLSSVETLGAATVIASDKTGTITKNEMTINFCHLDGIDYTVDGLGFEPKGEIKDQENKILNKENLEDKKIFFLSGYLASTAKINAPDEFHKTWYAIGDPTESAFATLAMKAGYDLDVIEKDYKRLQLFPFDSTRKLITILREHKGKHIAFTKGSIESVLKVSSSISEMGEIKPLDDSQRKALLDFARSYAAKGLRIIALAYKDIKDLKADYSQEEIEKDLIFSGFVSMMDPPNEGVKEAIEIAFKANLRLLMITGDNEITAAAIAEQIGMKNADGSLPQIINDKQLQGITDAELIEKLAQRTLIFSRVSPEEKLRIVTLLKDKGDIVAVTGDGVNDTLSLKKADIGVAMGLKGSKIAQEASSMVLLDDNFSTIVFAIEEGRNIYNNIQKNVKATLASNFAELICVLFGFVGVFFNLPIVILAIHILLIDLIGEMLPLIALSFDPAEKDLMLAKPRSQGQMVNSRILGSVLISGLTRGCIAIGAFFFVFNANAGNSIQHEKGVTATLITIIITQFVHMLCMRTQGFVLNKYLFSNKYLFIGMLVSSVLMIMLIYLPFFNINLHTGPLTLKEWSYPLLGALLYLFMYEVTKLISRSFQKSETKNLKTELLHV